MPIVDLEGNSEPIAHGIDPITGASVCPLCNYCSPSPIAFMQHMLLRHKRRYNRVTRLWEKH